AQVMVASSSSKKAKGMLGMLVQPDRLVGNVKAQDYDAIILVGGAGAREYWDNKAVHNLIKEALGLNKIVGAICIAPVTLARAGVLSGKKVTVFPSEAGQLKNNGVIFTGKHVQRDANIITADGPSAAREFGMAVVEALSGN
ncbi:MAG: DJ-1/PfpI family protein, partial [bacterium]